jgi:hypothetical protein
MYLTEKQIKNKKYLRFIIFEKLSRYEIKFL